ncbi:acetolactate synthase-1/2/3 large subunit [Gracilibacillus orientalis]|uniref:Acetolactate synthase-1/2/3 large subunit n=1 Tax=Gracilibacillus orientalis TaxID=334253 RepID=A0A1I4QQQ8_9BACI|nr:thiamine pyrophosphate-binding protein [Gracilibacillus orientalis]SFM42023.1 acetolactate synthase-1/2/3 large subunit [Gracilibacillus orientalis]
MKNILNETSEQLKASEIITDFIKGQGCTKVFGVPGKSVIPLVFSIDEKEMEFVLSRHECGAGFMAIGYALQNNTLGVAVGTSGPGGTNMVTSAAQASAFNAPVLFITGHPPLKQSGRALSQDSSVFGTNLVDVFKPVTKFSAKVESEDNLHLYLQHALEKAMSGPKGPVHLSIPSDILQKDIISSQMNYLKVEDPIISGNISKFFSMLEKAYRPALLIGKGAHGAKAYPEIQRLAEIWNIPVMTTPGGKGTFVSHHPLSLGTLGLGGAQAASDYLENGIDLLIVIGSKLSDMSTASFHEDNFPTKVIQFDVDSTFVGKSIPSETLMINGDAKKNLQHILHYTPESPKKITFKNETEIEDVLNDHPSEDNEFLSAAKCMKLLRSLLPSETITYGDDGSHTFHALRHFSVCKPGTFFFDDVFGAMGNGIGLSIGAKAASPNKIITCFTGDGCLFMHGLEISTAVCQNQPVIIYVFNNGMYDMLDKGMKTIHGKSVGVTFDTEINASELATSLGAIGHRCFTEEEIEKATLQALEEPHLPTVIELMVQKDEMPPIELRFK